MHSPPPNQNEEGHLSESSKSYRSYWPWNPFFSNVHDEKAAVPRVAVGSIPESCTLRDSPVERSNEDCQPRNSTSHSHGPVPSHLDDDLEKEVKSIAEVAHKYTTLTPELEKLTRTTLPEGSLDSSLHFSIPVSPERTITTPDSHELVTQQKPKSIDVNLKLDEAVLLSDKVSKLSLTPKRPTPLMSASTVTAWRQIKQLRLDIWSLRSEIRSERGKLREKQTVKSIAEDALIKHIMLRELQDQGHDPNPTKFQRKSMSGLMEECQRARDDYGPLEDECNALEDKLSGWEFKLGTLEEDFFTKFDNLSKSEVGESPDIEGKLKFLPATRSLNELEDMDSHPLVEKFLSRLGDLDLLQERQAEFMDDKAALKDEVLRRQRVGLSLDTLDQAWLDNSAVEEQELLDELRAAENEVKSLRRECQEKGLLDENDEPTNFQDQETVSFDQEGDINPKNHLSEYVKYPLLLPRPGIKTKDPEPDEKSDNITKRVNEWLLQRLRSSALDVRLLASTFEGNEEKVKRLNNDEWQILVLEVWYHDDIIAEAKKYRAYSSSLTTHVSHPSNSSDMYLI